MASSSRSQSGGRSTSGWFRALLARAVPIKRPWKETGPLKENRVILDNSYQISLLNIIDRNDYTPCSGCQNISTVFATSPKEPAIRQQWQNSKNTLAHHPTFIDLLDSSETCALCALIIAPFLHPQHLRRINAALQDLRRLDRSNLAVLYSVEEVYGSGGLISHLATKVFKRKNRLEYVDEDTSLRQFTSDYIPLADQLLRTYSEPGISVIFKCRRNC
jgi:hypothetical protein